ncbi:MAG: hypothetical protein JNM43_04955 [Planctomycetaceae bacterium]|nr:hypothetical protein [Planctomycetaceae bacterium]
MTSWEMKAVLDSKKKMRTRLAALPYAEKLRLLEAMRERHLSISAARPKSTVAPLK